LEENTERSCTKGEVTTTTSAYGGGKGAKKNFYPRKINDARLQSNSDAERKGVSRYLCTHWGRRWGKGTKE